MKVPWVWVSRPSSTLPRMPEVAVADGEQRLGDAKIIARCSRPR